MANSYGGPPAVRQFDFFSERFALQDLSPANAKKVFIDFLNHEFQSWVVDEFPLSELVKSGFVAYIGAAKSNGDETILNVDLATIRHRVWAEHDASEGLEKKCLRIIVCGLGSGAIKSLDNEEENAVDDFLSLVFGLVSRIGFDYLLRWQSYLESHPKIASVRMQ